MTSKTRNTTQLRDSGTSQKPSALRDRTNNPTTRVSTTSSRLKSAALELYKPRELPPNRATASPAEPRTAARVTAILQNTVSRGRIQPSEPHGELVALATVKVRPGYSLLTAVPVGKRKRAIAKAEPLFLAGADDEDEDVLDEETTSGQNGEKWRFAGTLAAPGESHVKTLQNEEDTEEIQEHGANTAKETAAKDGPDADASGSCASSGERPLDLPGEPLKEDKGFQEDATASQDVTQGNMSEDVALAPRVEEDVERPKKLRRIEGESGMNVHTEARPFAASEPLQTPVKHILLEGPGAGACSLAKDFHKLHGKHKDHQYKIRQASDQRRGHPKKTIRSCRTSWDLR